MYLHLQSKNVHFPVVMSPLRYRPLLDIQCHKCYNEKV